MSSSLLFNRESQTPESLLHWLRLELELMRISASVHFLPAVIQKALSALWSWLLYHALQWLVYGLFYLHDECKMLPIVATHNCTHGLHLVHRYPLLPALLQPINIGHCHLLENPAIIDYCIEIASSKNIQISSFPSGNALTFFLIKKPHPNI